MSSLLDAMSAMEGFLDPEMTSAKLLDAVRANVAEKVTTVDQAAALELKLSQEAAQFNDCLTTISNAIHKFERGEISKEEMMNESAPCVSALKTKCEALKLANVNVPGGDITEDEIATLREYIVGCKDIVAAHKEKLQACCGDAATEGLMASMENMEIATEANNMAKKAKALKQSTDAKTASQLYMQARKLYGLGSKEKAQKYLGQAKKLYEKLLATAKKEAKMYKVDRTNIRAGIGYGAGSAFGSGTADTQKGKEVTNNANYARLIAYFEDRIDACEALSRQWNNKAGNQSFSETKKALKLERAKTKAGMKARGKAEKDAMNYAKKYKPQTAEEAANEAELYEIVTATESMLDLMDMEDAMAMEAEGEDSAAGGDEKTAKLRELAVQLKQAQSAGDEATAKKITSQMNKLLDEIQKEAEDDMTQEDVDAAKRKAVKTALIVAGTVAAVGAGTAVGVKTGFFGKVANTLKEKAAKAKEKKGDAAKGETKGLFAGARQILSTITSKISALIPKKGAKTEGDADNADADAVAPEAWIDAMESFMDDLELDLAMEAALEAEGDDANSGSSPSGIAAKLRAAFSKLKKAKVEDNQQEAEEARREVKEAAEELEDAADEAETPEEKAKLSTAAKVGIAAAAVAAVTVGLTAVGQGLKAKANKDKQDPKGLAKIIITASDAVMRVPKSAIKGLKSAKGKLDMAAQRRERIKGGSAPENYKDNDAPTKANEKRARASKRAKPPRKWATPSKKADAAGAQSSWASESFLSNLAFGLEAELMDDEDEYFDPETDSKAFDPEADGEDMIDEAIESDLALEAAIDVMMAEDGVEDPED